MEIQTKVLEGQENVSGKNLKIELTKPQPAKVFTRTLSEIENEIKLNETNRDKITAILQELYSERELIKPISEAHDEQ